MFWKFLDIQVHSETHSERWSSFCFLYKVNSTQSALAFSKSISCETIRFCSGGLKQVDVVSGFTLQTTQQEETSGQGNEGTFDADCALVRHIRLLIPQSCLSSSKFHSHVLLKKQQDLPWSKSFPLLLQLHRIKRVRNFLWSSFKGGACEHL